MLRCFSAMVSSAAYSDMAGDRDLSWLNTSHVRALSHDGQTLLFTETALGTNYAVCLRKTDGSPVLRLGEGWPADLSADGKWVLAVVQSLPPKLLIYLTGAGETRQLERGSLDNHCQAVCRTEYRVRRSIFVEDAALSAVERHRRSTGGILHFWIFADVPDQNDLIDALCHERPPPRDFAFALSLIG